MLMGMKPLRLCAILASIPPLAMVVRGRIRPKNSRKRFPTIVVLGTAQYDGVPSRQFAGRLKWAAEQWHTQRSQKVVTVGGKLPEDRFTEAAVAREYLIKEHVDSDLIVAVGQGHDTRGSLRAALSELEQPILIITDPNHSLRAELIARSEGIAAWASPTPYCPTTFPRWQWWWTFVHEQGGLCVVLIELVAGKDVAQKVEDALRRLQAWLRPSRRARHEQLREER